MLKVLLIDNYDSFTYNLYQYIGEILEFSNTQFQLDVIRNDELTLDEIKKRNYNKIIISPGPGSPDDRSYFGVCADVLTDLGKTIPVLGVCLGMQGIAHYYGGKVIRAILPKHGKVSEITHDGIGVFKDLPQNIEVMRYHSLVASVADIPSCLKITAKVVHSDSYFEIMGLRHKEYPIEGIQFHPESFATEGGMMMLKNFINT